MRISAHKINNVYIKSSYSSVGKKEGEGPLGKYFDAVYKDELLGEKCWEEAESTLIKNTVMGALTEAEKTPDELDLILAGDLLNQCIASSYCIKDTGIPFLGLYGACSTFVEGLCIGSMILDGGFAENVAVATSSHFCSSEKQYRFPLEYGEVRTPTAQWTVTGSGCAVLNTTDGFAKITDITIGKILDLGITDANNMGAAMAPAACDTILSHFNASSFTPDDYDAIVTGDLAKVGSDILIELLLKNGMDLREKHIDCGSLIYDAQNQNVNSGGSGCGCIASVFCSYIAKKLKQKDIKRILLIATGALMSPSGVLVGETISGIAHAVTIEGV